MRFRAILLLTVLLVVSCSNAVQGINSPTPARQPTSPPTPVRQPDPSTADCKTTSPSAPPVHNLQDMLPGCDYAEWFEENTGYEPGDAYFGDYAILPWENALYLGFGKARPAEADGALFARFQSHTLTAIYQPTEQGFIDMSRNISRPIIHIPGVDPTDPGGGGSQWDWGNTYVYKPSTGTMIKHRNLPDVIHTWGLESTPDGLYAAVSSHLGDYKTWTGEVFRSNNLGASWRRLANKDAGVGDYRTYDIIRFNNKLYVTWNDVYGDPCGLAESADGGFAWSRLPEFSGYTNCRSRLFVFDDQLLILGSARDGILALHPDGSVDTHIFPDFRAQNWTYNPFAVDAQNHLYLVSEDNRILRTSDLEQWETLVASDRDFFTLGYWPAADAIIAGDRGVMGRLWELKPDASSIQQPPSPEATISLDGDDIILNWRIEAGFAYHTYLSMIFPSAQGPTRRMQASYRYRIYRSESPDFTPPIQFLHDVTQASLWRDAGVGSQPNALFYEVRSQNAAGDISGPSRTLGKFTFELIPGSRQGE